MFPLIFCGIGDLRGCELLGPLSGDMESAGASPGGAPLVRVLCDGNRAADCSRAE